MSASLRRFLPAFSNLIEEFKKTYPLVHLRIEEGTAEANIARLMARAVDVAFVLGEPSMPGCQTKLLWQERVVFALPNSHPLATQDVIAWDDVRFDRFIVNSDGLGPEVEICLIKRLAELGFRPDIQVHGVTRDNLLAMVG